MKRLLVIFPLLFAPALAAQSFDDLHQAIERGDFGNLKALVMSRHGDIIFEGYYRGTGSADLHQVHSVTKSVGASLIGIAHRQAKIHLDDDLEGFFEGLYDMTQGNPGLKRGITVEDILQQRHGIAWDEASVDYRNPLNPVYQMVQSADWYRFVLNRPQGAPPGTDFTYSTGASTLMSRMVRVATGLSPQAFAMQELFAPLGIQQVHWEGYSENGMGHGLTDWPNPDHDAPLGFSLWLTARDMLKIGELYLGGGVYGGRRILDRSWIDAAWRKHSHAGNSAYFADTQWGHGYQWWIATLTDELGRSWHLYFASGWGAQVIFVLPELRLVVASTADNYDHAGPTIGNLVSHYVLSRLNPWLDERFDGAWYDPATDGQGLTLEFRDEGQTVVGFWYTYGYGGEQRWFLVTGEVVDGEAQVAIYATSGGIFLQGDPYVLDEWGSGSFTARDCNHIDFEFESAEVSATVPLTRLTGVCFQPP